jgi:hypothetical protein
MNIPAGTLLAAHVHRIRSEYLEMPGLRLTSAQGQRLWGLEATSCAEALQFLVEAGFLRRTDADQYVRLTDGVIPTPPRRMAKATLGDTNTNAKAVS